MSYNFTMFDREGSVSVNLSSNNVTWVELIRRFQDFLRGCSFVFDEDFDMADILEKLHDEKMDLKYGKPVQSAAMKKAVENV